MASHRISLQNYLHVSVAMLCVCVFVSDLPLDEGNINSIKILLFKLCYSLYQFLFVITVRRTSFKEDNKLNSVELFLPGLPSANFLDTGTGAPFQNLKNC